MLIMLIKIFFDGGNFKSRGVILLIVILLIVALPSIILMRVILLTVIILSDIYLSIQCGKTTINFKHQMAVHLSVVVFSPLSNFGISAKMSKLPFLLNFLNHPLILFNVYTNYISCLIKNSSILISIYLIRIQISISDCVYILLCV